MQKLPTIVDPPPVPPPPPPPPPLPRDDLMTRTTTSAAGSEEGAEEEAQRACRRGFALVRNDIIRDEDYVVISHYQRTPSILQEGPKCGLVALCMLAGKMNLPVAVEEVFSAAKSLNLTRQGEMFSVEGLCKLAHQTLECPCEIITTDIEQIIDHLLLGKPVLIPYDADFNHEPCLKRGHKAHWAAVIGILVVAAQSSFQHMQDRCVPDRQNARLYHIRDDALSELRTSLHSAFHEKTGIFVYAKHGKSKLLALWSLHELINSNNNLCELDPERAKEIDMYVLPPGGVKGGLCSKTILIHDY